MAYSGFQPTKPAGSDAGTQVPIDTNRNDKALRDALLMLAMPGFDFSIEVGTGSAVRPQFMHWKQGSGGSAPWLKAEITWGTTSGAKYNPTTIAMSYSGNGGGAYDSMGSATLTYDSSGNLTAITGGASGAAMLLALIGQVFRHIDTYTTHAASTTAHSMLGMAQQAPSAVAITGGSIVTTTQNLTMPGAAALGTKNGAFNIDLSISHYFTVTIQAGAVATFINKPASGTVKGFTIEITNGGLVADQVLFPGCQAPGGALALSSSGKDLLHGLIRDGSLIMFTGTSPAMATLA